RVCVEVYPLQRCCFFFFFFQAEDGIRDGHVTGVQTCALPIYEVADRLDSSYQRATANSAGEVRPPSQEVLEKRAAAAATIRKTEIGRASCRERVEDTVGEGAVEEKKESGETRIAHIVRR